MNPKRAMNCPTGIRTFEILVCFFIPSSHRRFLCHRGGSDKRRIESGIGDRYPPVLPGSPPFYDAQFGEFE